jgi:hypothetical protein
LIRGIAHSLVQQYDPDGGLGDFDEDHWLWLRADELGTLPTPVGADLSDFHSQRGFQAVSMEQVVAMERRWHASGEKVEIFARCGRRRDVRSGSERLTWLVGGVLPRGTVTLLVGAPETGKSTLATELALAVGGAGGTHWLGRPISATSDGVAVLLTGEDDNALVNERRILLDPDDNAMNVVVYARDSRPLADLCKELAEIPNIDLLIADPVRRYLQGDEDGSDAVNQFFGQLEELAREKKCAVLVVHHLTKNAAPKSLAQVRHAIRGSAVFTDRPRLVLGMYRQDDVSHVGVIKHNLPKDAVLSEVTLRRDDRTLRHVVISADETAVAGAQEGKGVVPLVYEAVVRAIAKGERLTRTGARELWAHRLPELTNIGRDRIREAIDKLIAEGKLLVQGSDLVLAH